MKLIIANWKSHKTLVEAQEWLTDFKQKRMALDKARVVLCPPYPFLPVVADELPAGLELGVQDLSPFPAGSYTSAVSTRNLEGLSATLAILGHSETRKYFHVTHQEVVNKTDQALEARLTPVVCVDDEYIYEQANAFNSETKSKIMVAYEDLEAIGSGQPTDIHRVKETIDKIHDAFGDVPVLYGGSVDASNVAEYLEIVNGVIVGTASLEVDQFLDLLNRVDND